MDPDAEDTANLQAFIRTRRESIAEESNHEFAFSKVYISQGGLEATIGLISELELIGSKDRVLDVGCGLGGASISIAKEFGATVVGIDTSGNMLAKANDFLGQLKPEVKRKIQFDQVDLATADFEAGSFDVIFSREYTLWMQEEIGEAFITKFNKWLRPNGKLILVGFWKATKDSDDSTEESDTPAPWTLKSQEEQREILERVGFEQTIVRDMTEKCKTFLGEDIKSLLAAYNNSENGERARYSRMIKDWQQKLFLLDYECQKWGLIIAIKC